MATEDVEDRLARLRCVLNSLATRIPKIVLVRAEQSYPSLLESCTVSLSTHKSTFICLRCREHFNCPTILTRHYQLHEIGRAFVCDICDKGFNRRKQLDEHSRIHTGEKPFECDQCHIGLTTKRNLKKHMLSMHGQGFMCYICDDTFDTKDQLEQHSRKHNRPAPYRCDACLNYFRTRQSLMVHRKKVCALCEDSEDS